MSRGAGGGGRRPAGLGPAAMRGRSLLSRALGGRAAELACETFSFPRDRSAPGAEAGGRRVFCARCNLTVRLCERCHERALGRFEAAAAALDSALSRAAGHADWRLA